MTAGDKRDAARRASFAQRVGRELRLLREAAGLSQAAVADTFDWQKAAMSKIETGARPIALFEYLRLMQFYGEIEPGHPAVALAARLLPGIPPIQPGASD
jgi:transcriptional regulator with XRE-family HTH domain